MNGPDASLFEGERRAAEGGAEGEVVIKLIGVGGAGSNAVDRLKMENLRGLCMAVVNTDGQALASSPVQEKLLIGAGVTRGLGAGGDPELGRLAAEADRDKLAALVSGTELVFLIAGMGGGTGSGAAPILAAAAAEAGAVVIGFVTLPFSFEGGRRLKQAEEGLAALRKCCDAVIPLPNDILLQEACESASVLDSFARGDAWIGRGVRSIWSMLFRTGLINLDFATLRQAFHQRGGKTLFGLGSGEGADPAAAALEDLRLCPLLHTPEFSRKADRLMVNIVGGPDLTLARVNELMTSITEEFGREAHVVMGAVIDETMQRRVEVCVLGTTDISSRGSLRRAGEAREVSVRAERKPPPAPVPSQPRPAVPAAPEPAAVLQEEFPFGQADSRGRFDSTDRNLFDGEDLDVPTYLRKGIKIAL